MVNPLDWNPLQTTVGVCTVHDPRAPIFLGLLMHTGRPARVTHQPVLVQLMATLLYLSLGFLKVCIFPSTSKAGTGNLGGPQPLKRPTLGWGSGLDLTGA